MDFVAVLQQAVSREEGALAKRALVSRVLGTLGHREPPEQRRVSYEGRPETLFVWRGAPGGDLVLVGARMGTADQVEERQGVITWKCSAQEQPTVSSVEGERSAFGAVARADQLPSERRITLIEAATQLRRSFMKRFNREQEIRRERDLKYQLQAEARAARAAQQNQKGPVAGIPPR
jgi:hypothetical protein